MVIGEFRGGHVCIHRIKYGEIIRSAATNPLFTSVTRLSQLEKMLWVPFLCHALILDDDLNHFLSSTLRQGERIPPRNTSASPPNRRDYSDAMYKSMLPIGAGVLLVCR